MSERTVWRWLQAGAFPERRRRTERPTALAPLVPYLRERWAQGCHNATRLWHEARERGFTGGYGSVAAVVSTWRGEQYRWRGLTQTRRPAAAEAMASPRRVCWLLLGPEDTRTDTERAYLARLAAVCPQITAATALAATFAQVFQQRKVDDLHAWLARAEESGIGEFAAVARSIRTDRRAVEAAVRLEWSNGQVEGHVNRLKLIKRAMYGRANFDLLRQRVLRVV